MSDSITVDAARLPLLLGELRLPTVAKLWQTFTERADREGWPSARLLATLAEFEPPSEPSDVFSDIYWRRGCPRARATGCGRGARLSGRRPSTASTSPPFPWSAMLMSRRLPVAMPG